jgi:hypothetical protein
MIATRHVFTATVFAGALLLGACSHDNAPSKVDAAALKQAQEQLSQPAWLRQHLPARTVAYLRVPSPWGLIGGAPNGRAKPSVKTKR